MIKRRRLFSYSFLTKILFLTVTHFSIESYSQYLTGPVSSATGGAGIAANDVAEQVLYNPAVLVHEKGVAVGYFYADGYRAENEHDKFLALSVTDNSSDAGVAGGVVIAKRRRTFDQAPSSDDWYGQFAFATALFKKMSLGFSFEHIRHDFEGGEKLNQTDVTLGLFYNPLPTLGLGLVARNLRERDLSVPVAYQLKDEIGIGGYYIFMRQFRLRADLVQQTEMNPDHEQNLKMGFESLFNSFLVLRAGFQADDLNDRQFYTLGFGFTGPRLQIDYGFAQNTEGSQGAMHSVDFRLPF